MTGQKKKQGHVEIGAIDGIKTKTTYYYYWNGIISSSEYNKFFDNTLSQMISLDDVPKCLLMQMDDSLYDEPLAEAIRASKSK